MWRNSRLPVTASVLLRSFSSQVTSSASSSRARVALITGSGGGLGKCIAERFAAAGWNLVIADFRADAAHNTAKALTALRPAQSFLPSVVDVTNETAVTECVNSAVAQFGGLDCLVCNAGHQFICPVHELPLHEWRRMRSVHLDGAFLFSREVLKHMYAAAARNPHSRNNGKIIYMGSVHSKEASILKAPYVAAKHGLLGLARAVAKEAGPKYIAVNTICPGFVWTPLVEKQIPEQAAKLGMSNEDVVKKVMLSSRVDGQFAAMDDVASACLFLAEHPNAAFTGQSINISHGWHMD